MGLFKVREIKSREGKVHFQRYRVIESPWFNIYIHYIARSDQDKDPHNHPWFFMSMILWGGYIEKRYVSLSWKKDRQTISPELYRKRRTIFTIGLNEIYEFHKIKLVKPTWTLVVTGKRIVDNWGYLTKEGFVNHVEYRKRKNGNN